MKKQLLATLSTKGSRSLKELAQGLSTALGYKVLRTTKLNPKREQLCYGKSVDKLTQYQWFKDNSIPSLEFTTDRQQAKKWAGVDGFTVFGRKLLNSSCGKGIEVIDANSSADDLDSISVCPVYTIYRKKKREFRVHIFKNKVVAIVEKKRRKGFEGERDTKIRNLANGYVFTRITDSEPDGLRELSLKAAAVSQSDFRGVDVGYNEKNNELFVIEVNSAPGIQGSNIQAYINAIIN